MIEIICSHVFYLKKEIIKKIENSLGLQGSYGSYYQLNKKLGIKIIEVSRNGKVSKGSPSVAALKKTTIWKDAALECYFQNKAHSLFPLNIDPCLELCIIKKDNKFYPALLMAHIYGKDLWSLKDLELEDQLRKKWAKKFISKGLSHGDLNGFNILITKNNRVKIIDFGLMEEMEPWEKDTIL